MRKLFFFGATLLLAASPAPAVSSLGELYSFLRPILCAARNKVTNCDLPKDLVVPAPWDIVRANLENAKAVYIVGVPEDAERIKSILARRYRVGPAGKGTWLAIRKDAEKLREWLKDLKNSAGKDFRPPFEIEIVPVEEADIIGTVARIPFVLTDNKTFFPLVGALWAEPTSSGGIAETVLQVLRSGVSYLAAQASLRAKVESEESP